jgi:hypothetical protein
VFAPFNCPDCRGGAAEHGKPMKKVVLCAATILLAITAPVTAQKAVEALPDLGPDPADPIAETKLIMADILRDPDSARYRFGGIHQAHCKGGLAGKEWYGYAASIDVNATNAMGGYSGYQPYTILFVNGKAWRAIEGADFGAYGPAKGLLGLGGGAGVCRWLDR